MSAGRACWDSVYAGSPVTDVSWFQADPAVSVALVAATGAGTGEPVVDVGGGASRLVDRLLDAGYRDVSVLDVAADGLAATRTRLGPRAGEVSWIVADVLGWQPARRYRVWHDRAVFHFLADAADRDAYRAVLHRALAPGGHLVVGTFAADGPSRCSGLPTARYSPDALAAEFSAYRVVRTLREQHRTPAAGVQPFTWVLLADDASRTAT